MISVCLATYNGEVYIKHQLISILNQISPNDEVIISDDGSKDRTIDIIFSLKDERIKVIENKRVKSPIFNFENALLNASGDYIVLADQDDVWKNNKIEVLKEHLKIFDLVISDAEVIDGNGVLIHKSFIEINKSRKGFFNNLLKNSYLGCTMAFNRKILQKALPFPSDLPMHDWWIGLIGELFGKTYIINEPLISYRRHGNNFSPTAEKSSNSVFRKVLFRFKIVRSLSIRYLRLKIKSS